jgi:hypothetical protein
LTLRGAHITLRAHSGFNGATSRGDVLLAGDLPCRPHAASVFTRGSAFRWPGSRQFVRRLRHALPNLAKSNHTSVQETCHERQREG